MKFRLKCMAVFLAAVMSIAMTACANKESSSQPVESQVSSEESFSQPVESQPEQESSSQAVESQSEGTETEGLSDREMTEKYGTVWLAEKQDVLSQLSLKYPAPNFQRYSLFSTLSQIGWDYTQPVQVAGMIGDNATGVYYLEFDKSATDYAKECLGEYTRYLQNDLDASGFSKMDILRLSKIYYDVQEGKAVFILPGEWGYVESVKEESATEDVSSQVESDERTEDERVSENIDNAIKDICAQLGM